MFQQATSPRQVGVLNSNPERMTGTPKTITHFVPAQMAAVQYVDEQGAVHATVLMKVGNMWYMPPNAEQWAGALKPLASWLAKLCEEQVDLQKPSVPKEDVVDLFASQAQGTGT